VCGAALPWIVDVGGATFRAAVEESPVPVLTDFWASWCGPCKAVEPVVHGLAGEFAGRLKVARIDADQEPELSRRFSVLGLPTLLLLDRGEVRERLVGAVSIAVARERLTPHLAAPSR
jgi:thioredoxin 2